MTTASFLTNAYLSRLRPERAEVIRAVRGIILASLPDGYQEDLVGRNYKSLFYDAGPLHPFIIFNLGREIFSIEIGQNAIRVGGDSKALLCALRTNAVYQGRPSDSGLRFKTLEELDQDILAQVIYRLSRGTV
jgi:hypothetical protein